MIRVGFRTIGGAAWQGGRNYLWNLLFAITAAGADQLQPVLLLADGEEAGDLAMPGVECVTTAGPLQTRAVQLAGRVAKLGLGRFGRNPVERHWVRRARIDVMSHTSPVGGRVPTIAWIPDVQHRNLPQVASRTDHMMRDLLFREILRDADMVLTSSEAARQDLKKFFDADLSRCRVLRFVSQPRLAASNMLALDVLRKKFDLPARFVHLPNQLWKHKNHELVVEALRQVPDVVVVATGPREDYRHAGLYNELMAKVANYGLQDRFRHLGLVSFPELISLMHHCVAVINPSRFEGWSTTVEEAKSLGKRLVVSDIPVHREQDPPRATFFGVDDAAGLARQLAEVWSTHDAVADVQAADAATSALPERTRAFAALYTKIVNDVLQGRRE